MLVITNEAAGRTEAETVAGVVAELQAAGPVEMVVCHGEEDLDGALDRRGDRTLVVVGGDGSLHTTVRQLWRRKEADRCPVGVIPLGTGNDFARGVGIPLDPLEAARLILAIREPTPVDLITDDDGGVVVNAVHVGVGADAAVLARPLKPYLKIGSFPIGAILAGARTRGWHLRVDVDGKRVASGRRQVLMVGISNAPTIAGGTAQLAPDASPTDGVADVTISRAVRPLARIGYAVRLLRGTHADHPDVAVVRGRTVRIRGEPFHANADGEVVGPITARTWTVQPGAWHCVMPHAAA